MYLPMHLSVEGDGEAVAVAAGDLLDLDPMQRHDGLRVEHVAGVAMSQPPEVSPAHTRHLVWSPTKPVVQEKAAVWSAYHPQL